MTLRLRESSGVDGAMQTPYEPGAASIALNLNSLFVKQETFYFRSWRTL